MSAWEMIQKSVARMYPAKLFRDVLRKRDQLAREGKCPNTGVSEKGET